MKKVLFILIVSILFTSCEFPETVQHDIKSIENSYIVIIDSCEYIREHTYYNDIYIHKGNCKYCEQRRKQELETIIKELKK